MNFLYFILLCQFLISSAINLFCDKTFDRCAVKFRVFSGIKQVITPILKKTDQLLANKFLPIWTVPKILTKPLRRRKHVMSGVGHFTFYQDEETSSAAVFFHERQEFDGTIDSRYFIKDLIWNYKNEDDNQITTNNVHNRKSLRYFDSVRSDQYMSISVHSQYYSQNIIDIFKSSVRSTSEKIAYVETLVIINYDVIKKLMHQSDKYTRIVSYVLTLFNSVDMLYSKVKNPIIKINLAGIIINQRPFLHVEKICHEKISDDDGKLFDGLNVGCVNSFIMNFCKTHENTIPSGSYDVTVFLTRYGLHTYEYDFKTLSPKLKRLGGLAASPPNKYYELLKQGTMRPLVATISDRNEYESFPIIAHEMAHLLTVEHDSPIEDNNLMQPSGKFDPRSLSWSYNSLQQFNMFFKSPHSCMLANKPQSLNRRPQKTLSPDQQCQCYGYRYAKLGLCNAVRKYSGVNCMDNIICVGDNSQIYEGPIFMNGTPCGKHRVCWAQQCINIYR